MFEIYFSKDKHGKDNTKFKIKEQEQIIEAIRSTEDTISKVMTFSKTPPKGDIYRIPMIFEKITKTKFEEKHTNHFAMIDYPPIGTIWGKTIKFKGIEIKSNTAIITLCPMNEKDLFETVSHEVIHAFFDSFLNNSGVNNKNNKYFLEGMTEWLTKITSESQKKKKSS